MGSQFVFLCFGLVLCSADMVLNQRQVFVIVADWEPYLGCLGFTVCLWVIVPVYVFSPDRAV